MPNQFIGEAQNVQISDLLESVENMYTLSDVLNCEQILVRQFVPLLARIITPYDIHQCLLTYLSVPKKELSESHHFLSNLVLFSLVEEHSTFKLQELAVVSLHVYFEISEKPLYMKSYIDYLDCLATKMEMSFSATILNNRQKFLNRVFHLTKEVQVKDRILFLLSREDKEKTSSEDENKPAVNVHRTKKLFKDKKSKKL